MRQITHVLVECCECQNRQFIRVYQEDLDRWLRGEGHLQTIFPYLKASQREMFHSRICGECWDRLFKSEGDDE